MQTKRHNVMDDMALAGFRTLGKKIVCVGRNYKDHALELGNPIPTKPLLFLKSPNAYVQEGHPIITPAGCKNLHQEVELGVVIGKTAKSVPRSEAMSYVGGYTVALDMTARDFQDEAKKGGAPWFLAKSFDTACPVSKFIPKEEIPDPHAEELFCRINGVEKQRCKTNVMIFDIPTLIEYTTRFVTMEEGDLLLTGTPAGVCRVLPGDSIEFGLTDRITSKFVVQ
ncbi:FAH family protein [Ancylostoma ceylanicum]|uniref:Oxaloacetate tautomerase FAHD1, mitochondrial n=1 Tax=Ancylostoma ceylanicum TaxID=53326 RepID=A0A0D6LYD0_9BILA|nr:FAH family protein [Ancylostoma ceylanicum]